MSDPARNGVLAWRSAVLLSLPLVFPIGGKIRGDSFPVGDESMRAVVRIQAKHEGGWLLATGFVWNAPNTIVTALHVVAGSPRVTVRFNTAAGESGPYPATLERVLVDHDLALLRVTEPPDGIHVLRDRREATQAETVVALGYPFAIKDVDRTWLTVKHPQSRLCNIVHDDVCRAIKRAPVLSKDAMVISLGGDLCPGHSGAPVLDSKGRLVGIGNGGLDHGYTGKCWAIPAMQLPLLETSGEAILQEGAELQELFASERMTRPPRIRDDSQVLDHAVEAKQEFEKFRVRARLACSSAAQRAYEDLAEGSRLWHAEKGSRAEPLLESAIDMFGHARRQAAKEGVTEDGHSLVGYWVAKEDMRTSAMMRKLPRVFDLLRGCLRRRGLDDSRIEQLIVKAEHAQVPLFVEAEGKTGIARRISLE